MDSFIIGVGGSASGATVQGIAGTPSWLICRGQKKEPSATTYFERLFFDPQQKVDASGYPDEGTLRQTGMEDRIQNLMAVTRS